MQQISKLSSLVIRKIILHQKTINLRIFNLGNYCLQKTKTKYKAKQNKTKTVMCSQHYSKKFKNALKKSEKKSSNVFLKKLISKKIESKMYKYKSKSGNECDLNKPFWFGH